MHSKLVGLIAHTGKRGAASLVAKLKEEFERLPVEMKELVKKTYARELEETESRRKAAMVKAMKSEK